MNLFLQPGGPGWPQQIAQHDCRLHSYVEIQQLVAVSLQSLVQSGLCFQQASSVLALCPFILELSLLLHFSILVLESIMSPRDPTGAATAC